MYENSYFKSVHKIFNEFQYMCTLQPNNFTLDGMIRIFITVPFEIIPNWNVLQE